MDINDFIKYCEEKGFFYQSEKIYGGKSGFYDYGSLGKLIKIKFENIWRKYFLKLFENFWEIETSDIMKEIVFEASGHTELFYDLMVECKNGHKFRADKLIEEKLNIKVDGLKIEEINKIFNENKISCPECGESFLTIKQFNLMIPVNVGFSKEDLFFLRPETAQGAYVNFPIEIVINRYKLPLGLAIIGKAYRNEISPRNALLRMREFNQAELQIFFDYNDFDDFYEKIKSNYLNILLVKDRNTGKNFYKIKISDLEKYYPKFYLYFMYKIQQFYLEILKIPEERFRFFELSDEEKAFYNLYHFDIELFLDELGWTEVGGIHFRVIKISREDIEKIDNYEIKKNLLELIENKDYILVGYDLFKHFIFSKDKGFFINKDNKKIIPLELELSFGIDRNIFSILWIFYDKNNNILKLPKYLSPIEVAVFPLLESNEKHIEKARKVFDILRFNFNAFYDDSGKIGRRYKRQDSIGTPLCITIDEQTFLDNTVTIRFRDTRKQIRVKIEDLKEYLKNEFNLDFLEKIIKDM